MSDPAGGDATGVAAGVQAKLDWLTHAWDERNAMEPLMLALDGQAAISGLKEGWTPLRNALTTILDQHRATLLEAELAAVNELIQILDGILQG